PGFAIQYTAIVGAVFIAYDFRAGAIWGLLSGLQLFSFYLFHWEGGFPLAAQGSIPAEGPGKFFEMLAWGWALLWLIREIRSRPKEVPGASSVPPGST